MMMVLVMMTMLHDDKGYNGDGDGMCFKNMTTMMRDDDDT